ncbi:MAG TPA: aminopeptidase, partial [Thermoplasmata archaeon]|nr:aminopeptidase [Thermoplasmata archaeon]
GVIVESWNHGLDAARDFIYQLRAAGAKPMFLFEDEGTHWRSVETLPPAKLGQVPKAEWAALAEADAYIFLPGPADIVRYRRNMAKMGAATAYNSEWYRRGRKAGLRGARVLLGYCSPERAQAYGFDYAAWRAMLLEAGGADFGAISRRGKRLAALLSQDANVSVTAPNGTDLAFRLKGRAARCDDGIVDAQDRKEGEFMVGVPPGSSYVAPDEASAEGTVVGDLPIPYLGTLSRGVRFEFHDGKGSWTATEGGEAIRANYEKATGDKDRIGALGIGINPAMKYGFLQDDLVAGGVEISIGDNTEWGGKNKSGFSHSARLSQATVKIGRKTVVDGGRLTI